MIENWAPREEIASMPHTQVLRVFVHDSGVKKRLVSVHNSAHNQLYKPYVVSKALHPAIGIGCFDIEYTGSAINYAGKMYECTERNDIEIWFCMAYGVVLLSETCHSNTTRYLEPLWVIWGRDSIKALTSQEIYRKECTLWDKLSHV